MPFIRVLSIITGLLTLPILSINGMDTAYKNRDIPRLLTLIEQDSPKPEEAQNLYKHYVTKAAQQGHHQQLQELLNTTAYDKHFTTELLALLLHQFCDRLPVLTSIKLLLKFGAVDLNKHIDDDGNTPLMWAILQQSTYSLEAIRLILTTVHDIDLHIKNNEDQSVIDMADANNLSFDESVRQLFKDYVTIVKQTNSVPFLKSYKIKIGLVIFAALGLSAGIYGVYAYLHPNTHTDTPNDAQDTPDQLVEHTQDTAANSNL